MSNPAVATLDSGFVPLPLASILSFHRMPEATFSKMRTEPLRLKTPALSILGRYFTASLQFFIFLCDYVSDEQAMALAKATSTQNLFGFLFLFSPFSS